MRIIIAKTQEDISKFTQIAIKERLHRQWHLEEGDGVMYEWYRKPNQIEIITLGYLEYGNLIKYIGVCAIMKCLCRQSFVDIGTYVKKTYRMKGYGKQLYKTTKKERGGIVIHDSCGFYRKCA